MSTFVARLFNLIKSGRLLDAIGRRLNAPPQFADQTAGDGASVDPSATASTSAVAETEPPPHDYLPDWRNLLEKDAALWAQRGTGSGAGKKIVVATVIGGHPAIHAVESLVAMSLALRGADVQVLLCDGLLPACLQGAWINFQDRLQEFVEFGPAKSLCDGCISSGRVAFEPTTLPILTFRQILSEADIESAHQIADKIPIANVPAYSEGGIPIGEHALAGALRFFAKGNMSDEPDHEPVLRRYFEASLLAAKAGERLCQQGFEAFVMNHGIYVPHGPLAAAARKWKKRVAAWWLAYRKQCILFSHEDTYHHTLISEPTATWESMPWDEQMEAQTMDYLRSRWYGSNDWIYFHEHPEANAAVIQKELGIDFSKPTIGLLTNVVWDAQLHYPANAFPNMVDWLNKTIAYFGKRPELQLVIRIHPAEIRGTLPSRQLAVDEIKKMFPVLPENVFVIPPESSASTYAVMEQCDAVIIYGTKTGLELTSMSIPVIVAGEAWIRNKGLTLDARSEKEYFQILDTLPLSYRRLPPDVTQRARKYAYHFFFRRMIPVSVTQQRQGWPPIKIEVDSLSQLMPGADPGLDTICEGILNGTPFIFEAENLSASATADQPLSVPN